MNILAIDDEQLSLDSLVRDIKSTGIDAEVSEYTDPCLAISDIESGKCPVPNVMFVDVEMFGMTGLETAQQMYKLCPNVNVIFVTGFAQYAFDAAKLHASGYVLKPTNPQDIRRELESLRLPPKDNDCDREKVKIRTFGNFEVMAGGMPIAFSRSKAKELLAYLIDKCGKSVTTSEIQDLFWEDRPKDRSLLVQTQMIISSMMSSLKKVGAENIINKQHNSISVVTSAVDCDYYRLLHGDEKAKNEYLGEYMVNYSWAEVTNGKLFYN